MMLEEDSLSSPQDTEVLQTMKSETSPSGRWVIGFAQQCTTSLTMKRHACICIRYITEFGDQNILRITGKMVRQKCLRMSRLHNAKITSKFEHKLTRSIVELP